MGFSDTRVTVPLNAGPGIGAMVIPTVLFELYSESEPILQRIQSILKEDFQIYFSTIQVESEICPDIEQAEEIDFLRQPAMPSMDGESHQMHH